MKRFLSAFLLILPLGCGGVPPIAVGGGGVRLMNGSPESIAQAYEMAYSQISPQHIRLKRSLDPATSNVVGARTAVEQILRALETMQSLVSPADQKRFEPYIEFYDDSLKDLRVNRRSASFMSRSERYGREIQARFSLGNVTLATPAPAEAPVKTAARPAGARAPADDHVPSGNLAEAPTVTPPKTAPPKPDPAPKAAPSGIPYHLIFKAWEKAHEDLVAAQSAGKDCTRAYSDLKESLDLLGRDLDGRRAEKLKSYRSYYDEVHVDTAGFTKLPEKTTVKDITGRLNLVAGWIRRSFSPSDDGKR